MKRFLASISVLTVVLLSLFTASCSGNQKNKKITQLTEKEKIHSWYYFTEGGFSSVDLPKNVPSVIKKPWTESVRISSAASTPGGSGAYAVVNRSGILRFTKNGVRIFQDPVIFTDNSADSLVFSGNVPVFYLSKSTFFNSQFLSSASKLNNASSVKITGAETSRPFLVEFNPGENMCLPLVDYANIRLSNDDQVTGFFWNGDTWACSAKKMTGEKVEFSYFSWKPALPITELSPSLNSSFFTFAKLTEGEYRKLNTPKRFAQAPDTLKKILKDLPSEFSFYIKWRDESGNSPVGYFNEGKGDSSVNATGAVDNGSGASFVIFQDGTTYLETLDQNGEKKTVAFRLPKLPAGFKYGEAAVSGRKLYAAWEESSFYMTGRAGFIEVDIDGLLNRLAQYSE